MTAVDALGVSALAADYPWATCATIVDVGGGRGSLLASILNAAPNTQGVLLDQPHVIDRSITLWNNKYKHLDRRVSYVRSVCARA